MNILKFYFKLIPLVFFVIIFFTNLQAKNLNKYEKSNYVSNYFSGIVHLSESEYKKSYNSFKKLEGLESSHDNFSTKYLYSLVNGGKLSEAFLYSKKLEKKNLNNFESDLIIGLYYLKSEKHKLALKYFLKIKNQKVGIPINNFIIDSLINWASFKEVNFIEAEKKIKEIDNRFSNLKKIQNVFLYCFYNQEKTEYVFKKLVSDENTDFSRYNYFYSNFLIDSGHLNKAKKTINFSLKQYPRNLLLNQLKQDLDTNSFKKSFSCEDEKHIISEMFYITANALSLQSLYSLSNFYLNLAKYLNEDFYSYDTLLAENFYKIENFQTARKIYDDMSKKGSAFLWYTVKQKAKIFIKKGKQKKAISLMNRTYENLQHKGIYESFDYAEFLKNNEEFEKAIHLYSKLIDIINKDHSLYSEVTDGRGVAYESIGEWNKAEKDLLASLEANPNQAYVINYLAYSWIEKGINIKQSLEMLKNANNMQSNDPYIIDSLGWALFKLKRYKDAKNYLQQAVKLMPADPIVNDHFGDVLWKNGKKIQARYFWNYVLNLKTTEEEIKKDIINKLISGL